MLGFAGVRSYTVLTPSRYTAPNKIYMVVRRMDAKRMFTNRIFFSVVLLAALAFSSTPAVAASCESLTGLKLADTTITSAQTVAAGAFVPPGATAPPPAAKNLPAFCRVMVEIKPAKDSDIKMEVWLPLTGWNGKYRAQGNGGFAGRVHYSGLAVAITRGYATASTDTRHEAAAPD